MDREHASWPRLTEAIGMILKAAAEKVS